MNLTISNLTFGYFATKAVLDNLTISVASGSTVAIVGPSGCGKTTLLQIIAGILNRETEYYFNGELSWDGATDTRTLRRQGKIGYMFQTPVLLPHLTIAENVILPFISTSAGSPMNGQTARSLLERVGLAKFSDQFPYQLSVGMRARVALARTFATKPSLLLFDEPFSSLDIGWRLTLYNQWRTEVKARQPTTVLVTHDIGEAFLLAPIVVVMNTKGKITRILKRDEARPQNLDLESMRTFLHQMASIVEETQYEISKDVVLTSMEHMS